MFCDFLGGLEINILQQYVHTIETVKLRSHEEASESFAAERRLLRARLMDWESWLIQIGSWLVLKRSCWLKYLLVVLFPSFGCLHPCFTATGRNAEGGSGTCRRVQKRRHPPLFQSMDKPTVLSETTQCNQESCYKCGVPWVWEPKLLSGLMINLLRPRWPWFQILFGMVSLGSNILTVAHFETGIN